MSDKVTVDPSELVTVEQAAKELGRNRTSVWRRTQRGTIKSIEIAGTLFIYKSEIERLLKEAGTEDEKSLT